VNDDATEFDQYLPKPGIPSIVMYENMVYATWIDSRAGGTTGSNRDIYFAKGTMDATGKITFSQNIKINDTQQTSAATWVGAPAMALSQDGAIFIVWSDNRLDDDGGEGMSIFLARSLDGGETFLANQWIDDLPAQESYRHRRSPRIAAGDGYVYITFGKGAHASLEMAVSDDNGATFSTPREILPVPADTSVMAAQGSSLYIAHIASESQGSGLPPKYEVILHASHDNGQNFGPAIKINDDRPEDPALEKNKDDLSMAASGENVYLAWRDDRNALTGAGGQYVYGAVSHDRGAGFGANIILGPGDPARISGTSDDNRWAPSVSAHGDNVAVSFHGKVNGFQSVLARISTDRGLTWSHEMPASQNLSRPDIGPSSTAVGSSGVSVMWEADGRYAGHPGTGDNIYASGFIFDGQSPSCPQGISEFNSATSTLKLPSICIDGVYFEGNIELILDFNTMKFRLK
ncbi:MAG: exo-alpha-sialidase, partial [Desulfamplus sp.]|nr:exo-alpha-sialidase [Desulfamplus sp.]